MAKITNRGIIPITLPTGHVVPRLGDLDVDNDIIRSGDNAALLRSMSLAGQVTLTFDPETTPEAALVMVEKEASELALRQIELDVQADAIRAEIAARGADEAKAAADALAATLDAKARAEAEAEAVAKAEADAVRAEQDRAIAQNAAAETASGTNPQDADSIGEDNGTAGFIEIPAVATKVKK